MFILFDTFLFVQSRSSSHHLVREGSLYCTHPSSLLPLTMRDYTLKVDQP